MPRISTCFKCKITPRIHHHTSLVYNITKDLHS